MNPYRKIIKVGIIEVGDYSLYIDLMTNSIDEVKVFRITSFDGNKRYEAKEVIISDRKCIAYFNESVKSAFHKGVYWGAYVSNVDNAYWDYLEAEENCSYDWYNIYRHNKNSYYNTSSIK